MRIGIGYDVHPLAAGRPLRLGGVDIPHHAGLAGHSDGDALLHAVADALLGAAAMGDLGGHFPDTDPQFKGADSRELLREVARRVREAGWAPSNVDCTVIAQQPRLAPHISAMRQNLAQDLCLAPERVSVKATSPEGLGALGHEAGIAAQAVVLLEPV